MDSIFKIKIKEDQNVFSQPGEISIYRDWWDFLRSKRLELSKELASLDGPGVKALFFKLRRQLLDALVEYLIARNQYIYIDGDFRAGLERTYNKNLLEIVKALVLDDYRSLEENLRALEASLVAYLLKFEEVGLVAKNMEPIPNYQYGPKRQLELLGLEELRGPILDIGCGRDYKLVSYLRQEGLEAYGIDRYNFREDYLANKSWLDFDYGRDRWGTIVAHMSFTNHFTRENLKAQGLHLAYAKTYMKILESLRPAGSFYYAPDLDFMEEFLDRELYEVSYRETGTDHKSVRVKRLAD